MKQLNLLGHIDKLNPPVTKPKDKSIENNIRLKKLAYLQS